MDTKGPLIFIVDDDNAFVFLIKRELERINYKNLKTFTTGIECIHNLNLKPDIVLLDYSLEMDLNGLEVLKKIKSTMPSTYVILLTAAERIEIVIETLKNGAFDYVIKNEVALIKINELIKKIIQIEGQSEISR